jgi:class 3 adenylate cyclase
MATQTLTILLADLVGSSTHLTSVPQKQAVEYLQDATLPIREIIEDHEGIVIKFTGDGYLAAFESVAQALRAGEKIRHHFLRQTHTPTGISLDGVRVIINTADVTVQDDDIMGDGVALVSRLEKDVPTNQVYVTRAVQAVADDAEFSFEQAGEMRPRGWHRPVKVYQLLSTEASFVDPGVFLLITDLHGLISTGESLPAGDVKQWLLTWGDMHREAVVGLKGRVRQFIADMALVTFTNADDALDAVLKLRVLAARHNATRQDLPAIEFAAAISTGDLILSPTGIVGRLVNQTFRLINASPRCTVTIDHPVYDQLSARHDLFAPATRIDKDGTSVPVHELIENQTV